MTLLSADAYFNKKVKAGNNVCGTTFLCVLLVWWLGRKHLDTF